MASSSSSDPKPPSTPPPSMLLQQDEFLPLLKQATLPQPITPRSRQTSSSAPSRPFAIGSPSPLSLSRFSSSSNSSPSSPSPSPGSSCSWSRWWMGLVSLLRSGGGTGTARRRKSGGVTTGAGGKAWQRRRRMKGLAVWSAVVVFFFVMNWWMFSRLEDPPIRLRRKDQLPSNATLAPLPRPSTMDKWSIYGKDRKSSGVMFTRLLALAAHAVAEAESKPEPQDLWLEPVDPASSWNPCAHERNWEPCDGRNGYILISANGGINQQRVATCNAVAIARLLNATLVIPHLLFNSVWKDKSLFSDIYQEEHFINYLKNDIKIVRELPMDLRSLNLEAIGSLVTDAEVMKESKPSFYIKRILPILIKNRVIHFVGFGNRLAFDPVPFDLQRLRCRCNFHALRFVNDIQKTGSLLVHRLRNHKSRSAELEHNLLGPYAEKLKSKRKKNVVPKYLAVHLRFEIDMAAYSMCYFGGGKEEEEELEAYRAIHFPALAQLKNTSKVPSAAFLRSEGQCPLTPEEAVLMLVALGFKRRTKIYVAGAQIYGGKLRMAAVNSLYPNLATKESLLSPSEIEPFRDFSSKLAALDFIVCAAADAFAMTDSGSQLSSLVSGYRMYYGGGNLPTIRPNKRRLASIFSRNHTIEWRQFEERVRKAVKQTKQVHERPVARSVYRHPRCLECMCRIE